MLSTAFTGFRAAVVESARQRGDETAVVVHTGFWGCGAFGGNRVLMALLQALAARVAGLHRLVLHTFDAAGTGALEKAKGELAGLSARRPEAEVAPQVDRIVARGFQWGVSDGN